MYYISKLLAELGLSNSKSKTNLKAAHSIEEIIPANTTYCYKFDLNITELDELLPIMYCLPIIHKTPVGARFIVASYYWSTNPLSDKISKNFKMILTLQKVFIKKGFFYLGCKKFKILLAKLAVILELGLRSISKKITSLMFLSIYTPPQHALTHIILFVSK